MMIMWKPKYFHEMITNSVTITRVESPSQSWMSPSRPTVARDESTTESGCSISVKTIPVTASDRTYGRKNSRRRTARPRKRRLSRTARARLNGIWMNSDRTTISTLLPTEVMNGLLPNAVT